MRFGEEIEVVGAGSAVRVAPHTVRSHRNEGDEPVEIWALFPPSGDDGGEKVDDFWAASAAAAQHR
ncbi:MAG TPA: hypothetical protein VFN82_02860 [Solirubrobacterales bacterium]|nr:hypothetical protein [Solirubrobacterales bacterium]